MRIGLLGGTFNPAHDGHLHISREAIKRLGLDQVWWLVTPGNPLKPAGNKDNYKERLESAEKIAVKQPRIIISEIEKKLNTIYTIDTLQALKNEFPSHQFIWLMGADNLANFHKWHKWQEIFHTVPVAVFDRPGDSYSVLNSKAGIAFKDQMLTETAAKSIFARTVPAWCFIKSRKLAVSSTELRKSRRSE